MTTLPSAPDPTGIRLQQMTIFICEQDHWHHRPLYLAILEQVRAQGGAGASVLKGLAGYSARNRAIHTSTLVDVATQLPLVILIVDTAEQIAALLPAVEEMVAANGGLITVVDVVAHRYRHPSQAAARRAPLKVHQIMESNVVTVGPDTPVADLLPLLVNKHYKALPVVDAGRHVLGMVTDVDLLEKADIGLRISVLEAIRAQGAAGFEAVLAAARASGKTARAVMGVRPDAVIGPEATVAEAAQRMLDQGVKRLPVVDRDRRLLGIVGRLDILQAASHVLTTAHGPEAGPPLPAHARTLGEIVQTDVATVDDDTPLAAVVDTIVGQGARRLIVTDSPSARHVVGIITDADLIHRVTPPARPGLLRMLQEGLEFLRLGHDEQDQAERMQQRTARDVMTTPVVTAPAALPLGEGIRLMVERGVKVLPVVDADGRLLGVVNRARLLEALLQGAGEAAPPPAPAPPA